MAKNPMDREAWWATVHRSQRVRHGWVTGHTHTHTHTHTLYYYPNNNNTIRLNWLIFFFSWEVLPKTMNISKRNQGLVSNRAQTTLNRFKLSSVQLYTCSVAVHGITKSRTQLGDWTKTIIYQVIKHLHIWSPKHCNVLRIHE